MPTTSTIALFLGAFLLAYLSGSLNTSILVARLSGRRDPRSAGSKNAGATNVLRTMGRKAALFVLFIDFSKAYLTIFALDKLNIDGIGAAFALPYLLGNLFPVFHGFRGGKGVAAVVGTFSAVEPWAVLLGGCLFLLVLAASRRVSLGSIIMVMSYPIWCAVLHAPCVTTITAGTLATVIVLTHIPNIKRLIRGEEPRIGSHTKSKAP